MLGRFIDAPPLVLAFLAITPFAILYILKAWLSLALNLENNIPSGRAIPLFIGFYLAFLSFAISQKSLNEWALKVLLPIIIVFVFLSVIAGIWEKSYLTSHGYSISSEHDNLLKNLLLPTYIK